MIYVLTLATLTAFALVGWAMGPTLLLAAVGLSILVHSLQRRSSNRTRDAEAERTLDDVCRRVASRPTAAARGSRAVSHRGRHGGAKRAKLDERTRRQPAPWTAHNGPRNVATVERTVVDALVRAWNLERMAKNAARRKAALERKLARCA